MFREPICHAVPVTRGNVRLTGGLRLVRQILSPAGAFHHCCGVVEVETEISDDGLDDFVHGFHEVRFLPATSKVRQAKAPPDATASAGALTSSQFQDRCGATVPNAPQCPQASLVARGDSKSKWFDEVKLMLSEATAKTLALPNSAANYRVFVVLDPNDTINDGTHELMNRYLTWRRARARGER
jgi:hypothetical protein